MAAVAALLCACTDENAPAANDLAVQQIALGVADAETQAFIGALADATRTHPKDGTARGELAMAYDVNGFADAALVSYAQAQALAPADPRWPYHRALLLAHRGEFAAALEALSHAIDLAPEHTPAWLWRGTWLLDLGRLEDADAAFREAERRGAGAPAQAGRARVALRADRVDDALALLRPLDAARRHSDVGQLFAKALRRAGRAEAARAALAAIHAGPLRWPDARSDEKRGFEASLAARLASARRALAAGDAESALAAALTLRERHPRHQGLLALAIEAHRQLGNGAEAVALLRAGIAMHPNYYPFHLSLAERLIESGAQDDAMGHLDRALALNPRLAWAHAQRGLLLLEGKQEDAALAAFQAAMREDPASPAPRYYAGMVHASRRRWQDAIALFTAATRADPAFTLAHLGRGQALAEVGRFADARAALGEAQRLGTHPRETAAALAWLARRERSRP